MKEIWKPVVGYEGAYEVSNCGRVRTLHYHRGSQVRVMQHDKSASYDLVTLYKDGKPFCKSVHRLVAEAFLPNPNNYPVVNHIDENKRNNVVENLEWCSQQYNVTYGHAHDRFIRPIVATVIETGEREYYNSIKEARYKFGRKSGHISEVLSGHRKTAYGRTWADVIV